MNGTPAMPPIHPGVVLMQEYLEPLGVTQHRLAVAIGVPPRRINEAGCAPPSRKFSHWPSPRASCRGARHRQRIDLRP